MSQFRHEIMKTINTKPAQLRKDTLSCKKKKNNKADTDNLEITKP